MSDIDQQETFRPAKMPVIQNINISDIKASLKEGMADFRAAPLFGLFFGGIYTAGGLIIL